MRAAGDGFRRSNWPRRSRPRAWAASRYVRSGNWRRTRHRDGRRTHRYNIPLAEREGGWLALFFTGATPPHQVNSRFAASAPTKRVLRMYRSYLLPAAIAAAFVAGCASMNQASNEDSADKTQITGSRIPHRDSSTSSSVQQSTDRNPVGAIVPSSAGSAMPPGH